MGDHWKQVWLYICIKISVLYFSYISWVTIENKFDCTFVLRSVYCLQMLCFDLCFYYSSMYLLICLTQFNLITILLNEF